MPQALRTVWISLLIILLFRFTALADIYRYMDKNGVWHFTNVPTNAQYRLFIKTGREKAAGYVKKYIEKYETIIQQASTRFGVDPCLVKAVIKAESDFDCSAVSRCGAQGLMQLMPTTANDLNVNDPFDPIENIYGGTRYLKLMLDRFNNDKILALSAYNAGPEAVEKYHRVPPFKETESFVKRVLKYYTRFTRQKSKNPKSH